MRRSLPVALLAGLIFLPAGLEAQTALPDPVLPEVHQQYFGSRAKVIAAREARRAHMAKIHAASRYRRHRMEGAAVEKAVRRLASELRWHDSLDAALAAARASAKPVLWVQALGELTGYT